MLYHVRISQKSNKSHDETKVDVTEDELKERYVNRYELGEPIIINGKTIQANDIDRIRVTCSEQSATNFFPQLKAKDANSSVLVIGGPSYEWRAADLGKDVTDKFITGAPGHARSAGKHELANGKKVPREAKAEKRVFVVHGHDNALKNDMAVFLQEIGLDPIVLHREPDEGLTVIEKFERYGDVAFVIVLLTPDDIAGTKDEFAKLEKDRKLELRARQNVIFEFGYFIGKLGRNKVCCVYKKGVAVPTDVSGMLYKEVKESVQDVAYSLIKELQAAGIQVKFK